MSEDSQTAVETAEQNALQDNDTSNSRTMVLISLEQRGALLEYLAKQPYQDVAGGIEFLRNAIPINVNFTNDGDPEGGETAAN